jgi:hypothetical protein
MSIFHPNSAEGTNVRVAHSDDARSSNVGLDNREIIKGARVMRVAGILNRAFRRGLPLLRRGIVESLHTWAAGHLRERPYSDEKHSWSLNECDLH